ncbi:putative secreted effector protein [Blumeria graminis f. sp. tritici 96224]|nr:putative secreted effector protein [Blumeria graminis f. sp. tritici 96224]
MIFEIPYVQASLTVAREKNLKKKKPNIYPIKISQPGVDGDKYEWPLCRKNNIYGPNCRRTSKSKYSLDSNHFKIDRSTVISIMFLIQIGVMLYRSLINPILYGEYAR